ncbi:MAG: aspartate--ammonia ligase [Clostridiales bacterium]|nr:MAG: aspartate--ammonia ligase [Clostridiales bacterium]
MSKIVIPQGYKSTLNLYQTQTAIGFTNRTFEKELGQALNLKRVSAPIFVEGKTGLNDDLNGVERAVSFSISETGTEAQIVHSLAKWKRMALYRYNFEPGEGLYTIMNAIRRDEEMDNIHSIYVDQWDWEKVITAENRNIDYLKDTVCSIVGALCNTLDKLKEEYPELKTELSREVTFVTTQELEDMYPDKTPKERENIFVKEHPTTFIMQIGDLLKSGIKHDGRAPDYDDWQLNGDIVFWHETLEMAFEVSSMGIRVSPKSLDEQLTKAGCDDRREFMFHKMLLNGELPLTIGGGIGQSRVSMLMLQKAHIGEVQVSVWDEQTKTVCKENGIMIL